MTNYNDGNWHGWNGGECPVHPKSTVEFIAKTNEEANVWEANIVDWFSHENPVIAFRVIKEHREPREWFGWRGASGHCEFFEDEERLQEHVSKFGRKITCFKVREVIE